MLPKELKLLREKIDTLNIALGEEKKDIQKNEIFQNKILKKGIIAKHDLKKGHRININDLDFARPALYFNANDINLLIGKKIKRNISKGYLFKKNIIK